MHLITLNTTVVHPNTRLASMSILLIGLLLLSCEYNVENDDIQTECDSPVSYNTTIRPLIDSNCMPCHNGNGNEPFAPDLTTYARVAGVAGLIKEVTQSRQMPKEGSLTNAQIAAIKCWVDEGALNN